jgi:hypothetical protein
LGPIPYVGVSELIQTGGVWEALRLNEVPAAAQVADSAGTPSGG